MNKRAIMWGILLSIPLWVGIGWVYEICVHAQYPALVNQILEEGAEQEKRNEQITQPDQLACEQCNFLAEHAKGQRVTTPSAKASPMPVPLNPRNDWMEKIVPEQTTEPTPNSACAIVPGFQPHHIVTMKGNGHVYQGETVYTKDGCPALLVLIPIDKEGFKVNGKATPTPASNGE